MSNRIFVTGIGIISAIGKNVNETLDSIHSNNSGIGNISNLDTYHKNKIPVAEVKLSDNELFTIAGINSQPGYTRTSLLGMIAAREALQNSKNNNILMNYSPRILSPIELQILQGFSRDSTGRFFPMFIFWGPLSFRRDVSGRQFFTMDSSVLYQLLRSKNLLLLHHYFWGWKNNLIYIINWLPIF